MFCANLMELIGVNFGEKPISQAGDWKNKLLSTHLNKLNAITFSDGRYEQNV